MADFNDAQIATDIGRIFTHLSDTSASDTITHTDSSDNTDTFAVIRAKSLSERDLRDVGWARAYKLSCYSTVADGAGVALGDTFTFATEGILRVLNISRGPTQGYIRFDMGDPYSGGL